MLEDARDKLVAQRREANAVRIFRRLAGEQVGAGLQVIERHVEVGAIAGLVGKGLGHHGRQQAFFARVVLGHVAEEGQPVAGGQRVGILEVELELAMRIFMVKGIQVPAQAIDGRGHLVEPAEAVGEAAHVVAGLGELVLGVRHRQLAGLVLLEQEDLALDAQVQSIPQLGRLGQLVLQRHARVERIGLALEVVVRGDPRNFRLPRQLDQATEVRHRGDLVIVGRLAQAVQGIAGVALGAFGHVPHVVDGHYLGLRHAVDVHIGADAVLHALGDQVLLQLGNVDVWGHVKSCEK